MICRTSFRKSKDTFITRNIAHAEYTCANEERGQIADEYQPDHKLTEIVYHLLGA